MKKRYRVVITLSAKESLREIIEYIKKSSPSAATKVRKRLIDIVKSLNESPERFSREEYLPFEPGNYRSVTQWHYKILYKVFENDVVILRFIHTAQNPDVIKELKTPD